MSRKRRRAGRESEVAVWHLLSGQPDNVTDDGQVIDGATERRTQSEKELLRAEIARLRESRSPEQAAGLARLAASYLLAGDVETAQRYVKAARALLDQHDA